MKQTVLYVSKYHHDKGHHGQHPDGPVQMHSRRGDDSSDTNKDALASARNEANHDFLDKLADMSHGRKDKQLRKKSSLDALKAGDKISRRLAGDG